MYIKRTTDCGQNIEKRRLMIAGMASGCGKTTIVCGILAALKAKGLRVGSFKCGPDYIDPMFHRSVLGIPSYNLDPWFYNKDELCGFAAIMSKNTDISVMEGVMGYYDGIGFSSLCSSYQVAKDTMTPVVIIVDAAGMGSSSIAVLEGFLNYKPKGFPDSEQKDSFIRGVIFNRMSKSLYQEAEKATRSLGIIPLGYLPRNPDISINSRHLGLMIPDDSPSEHAELAGKIRTLHELIVHTVDIDGLFDLASMAAPLTNHIKGLSSGCKTGIEKPRIAVAKDPAFCFFYPQDALILEELGCELVYFSPLRGDTIPKDVCGLILPGGYPEVYAKSLSSNTEFLCQLNEAISHGLPTIAECGGFMVLHDEIEALDGSLYPMAGVIHGVCKRGDRLKHFGYVTIRPEAEGLLSAKGDVLKGHEFHYWDSTASGASFTATKASNSASWKTGYSMPNLYAGFPHIPLSANKEAAKRFVRAAAAF